MSKHIWLIAALLSCFFASESHAQDPSDKLLRATRTGDFMTAIEIILHEPKINVNVKDEKGLTPLHYVFLSRGNEDEKGALVTVLVATGANVNAKDKDGCSILMMAAIQSDIVILEILAVKGANVNAKANNGKTALMVAAYHGRADAVKYLIERGASVNAKDKDDMTALISASDKGHNAIVETLLANGAQVNAKSKNFGVTALMIAAARGHIAIVKMLLAKGADVNAKSKKGTTALFHATEKGRSEIIALLKQAGASE